MYEAQDDSPRTMEVQIAWSWDMTNWTRPPVREQFIPRGAALPDGAEPFDIPGVRYSHHGGHCSFHALLEEHELTDPVLQRIARIIDEADTIQSVSIEPAAAGLDLICEGIRLTSPDDEAALANGEIVYDALYARLAQDAI